MVTGVMLIILSDPFSTHMRRAHTNEALEFLHISVDRMFLHALIIALSTISNFVFVLFLFTFYPVKVCDCTISVYCAFFVYSNSKIDHRFCSYFEHLE